MRHGTLAAFAVCTLADGEPCDGCRLAMMLRARTTPEKPPRDRARLRVSPKSGRWQTYSKLMAAEPYIRVVRTLIESGSTAVRIAELTGLSPQAIRLLDRGVTQFVYPNTVEALRRLLDHLPSEQVSA